MKHLPSALRGSHHMTTSRMRAERRRALGVLREIVTITAVAVGRGTGQSMLLECGHTVLHLNRRDLRVGGYTGCPECE